MRRIQNMGEAAGRLPEDFKAEHPDVPRRRIIAMRHRLAHEYDSIDLKIVRDIVGNRQDGLKGYPAPILASD